MAVVFDPEMEAMYSAWYCSREGRAVEKALEEMFRVLLKPRPGQRVLDVGCGTGNHLLILSRIGLNVCGIDASEHMISKARERLGQRCLLERAWAEELPFEDNEFDLVVLINTLEFVEDPIRVLREAGRVASEKVFVGVINSFSWRALRARILKSWSDPLFREARFFNLWQMLTFLRAAFGSVPFEWLCASPYPTMIEKLWVPDQDFWGGRRAPWGLLLGICCPIVYTVKTDNLLVKVKPERIPNPAGQVPISTLWPMGIRGGGKGRDYERGIPL